MSRAIKFRAWNNFERAFYPKPFLLSNDGLPFVYNEDYLYIEDYDAVNPAMGLTIQQFTGLKDSKGIEIYEGDILAENYTAEMAAFGSDAHVGDVYFESGAFLIRGGDTLFDLTCSASPNIVELYSVVGNINQNSELTS